MSLKVVRFILAFIISLALACPVFPVLALETSEANAAYRWIRVTSPNGGETMTVGDVHRITWNSSANIDRVSIGYGSCPYFFCLSWIVTNIPNTGYYDWTVDVGNTTKTQFKIQIIGYQIGTGFATDLSDSYFTVLPKPTATSTPTETPTATNTPVPWITVTSPNGGEIINYGDIYTITWQSSSDISKVLISTWSCVNCPYDKKLEWGSEQLPNTGSYDWTVTVDDPINKQYLINIVGIGDYDVILAEDDSDGSFTVVYPTSPTPEPTSTDNICIAIEAEIAEVDDPMGFLSGNISAGDEISGSYVYDLNSIDSNPVSTVGDYIHNTEPYGITLNAGGLVFRTDPNNVEFWVEIVNDHGDPASDNYLIRSYYNEFSVSFPEGTNTIDWQLDDPTLAALSSEALPAEPPDLTDWQSLTGLTIESWGQNFDEHFLIRAHVTSAYACGQIPTAVPTPSPTPEWPLPITITKPVAGEILTYGEISQIVWEVSSEMPYVYMELVSRCMGCTENNWEQEIDWGFSSNGGDMGWVVLVDEPLDKEFAVHIEGIGADGFSVTGEGLTGPFYIAYGVMPTVPIITLQTPTVTATLTQTLTSTPTDTATPTPTATPTETVTSTSTPTNTNTPTRTNTITRTSTATRTRTPTRTPTSTPTLFSTPTETPNP